MYYDNHLFILIQYTIFVSSLKQKHTTMKKAIIYTRVSTVNQDTQRQINDLQEWATANKYEVVKVFQDVQSGKTAAKSRKGSKAMFDYLNDNKIDIVLCSEISRLGRSAIDVQKNINEIVFEKNISLYIRQQGLISHIDGQINSTFKLISDVLANVAQMEREQISERVKSGLRNAVKNGKTLGRAKGSTKDNATFLSENKNVVKYLKEGLSIRNVAKICDVSPNTVQKVKSLIG